MRDFLSILSYVFFAFAIFGGFVAGSASNWITGLAVFFSCFFSAVSFAVLSKFVEAADIYIKINKPIIEDEKARNKRLAEIQTEINALKDAQKIINAENE